MIRVHRFASYRSGLPPIRYVNLHACLFYLLVLHITATRTQSPNWSILSANRYKMFSETILEDFSRKRWGDRKGISRFLTQMSILPTKRTPCRGAADDRRHTSPSNIQRKFKEVFNKRFKIKYIWVNLGYGSFYDTKAILCGWSIFQNDLIQYGRYFKNLSSKITSCPQNPNRAWHKFSFSSNSH